MRNWCSWIFQLLRKKDVISDEERVRRYQEEMDRQILFDAERDARKKTTLFERIILDIRWRIFFGTVLAIFIGVCIPLIIYFVQQPSDPDPIYGSCYLRHEYRVKCLLHQHRDPTEDECIAAKCCWNNNDTLPFKCFHSLASAYQYFVYNTEEDPDSGTISLDISPNLQDRMSNLKVLLKWENADHFNVQIYNPATYTPQSTGGNSKKLYGQNFQDTDDECDQDDCRRNAGEFDSGEFNLNYATLSEFFHLKITRNSTQEVIFDTRLGPLIGNTDFISFVTALPTRFFYGVGGGMGEGAAIYDNFNKFGLSELPFYMTLESSGNVYGLFLKTSYPFTTQFLEAPGLMFHLQGPQVVLDMHFFVGPTVKLVYQQLYSYLNLNVDETSHPKMHIPPPYWALGLHLCRTATDETDALAHIQNLTSFGIPYDSDCIDENLRTPYQLDTSRYPERLVQILELLQRQDTRILLTQKMGLPVTTTNLTSIRPILIMKNETESLIGYNEPSGSSESEIYYLDFISPDVLPWLESEYDMMEPTSNLVGGLSITENYPLTYNSSKVCEGTTHIGSRLDQNFQTANPEFLDKGLICRDSMHLMNSTSGPKSHFEVHNLYGHESLLKLQDAFQVTINPENDRRMIFTSSSIWTDSFFFGGFNGPEVPFSWEGMIDSLAYLLRNFMFLPFSGTPICGSYLPANYDSSNTESADNLCFRWFQLGLLFPFARNSYKTNGPRGILDMKAAYRENIKENIHERYKYNPYYYTLFYEYSTSEIPEPLIRPLVYDFPEVASSITFRTLSQFMIGDALMAAPILTQSSTQREAYFPPGIWFNLAGSVQWSNEEEGGVQMIEGFVKELPIYLRSGYVIPTLVVEEPREGNAMKSREGNYSIIGTFPSTQEAESKGLLFLDDGIQINSTGTTDYDLLHFTVTNYEFRIESTCGLQHTTLSKLISQIKIFNFPSDPENVSLKKDDQEPVDLVGKTYFDEYNVLYLNNLDLNWCSFSNLIVNWCNAQRTRILSNR